MKTGFLIIGRLKSTRLPKKIMLDVEGKPYLEHMFDHIRLSKKTDVIVMCTSTNPEDDPLEACAQKNGVECFRGSEDDVVKRLYDASVKYGLDYILTITADCPLVDPVYADKVAKAFEKNNADLITAMDLPHGAFTHGIKPAALKMIMEIKESSDTEVWGRYFTDTGLFETFSLPIKNKKHHRPDIRMTLDYPEDHAFFKALFAGLYKNGKVFSLDDIIDYLENHPEISTINKDCAQLYLTRYTKQSEIKLKSRFDIKKAIVFGCGSIGQRHIRNLRQLGYKDIAAFRTREGHYQDLPSELEVKELTQWGQVKDFGADVAIISNPTSLHLDAAVRIADHVKGLLIEKPLSYSMEGVNDFLDMVKSKRIVTFVGYNLLLHPAIKAINKEIEQSYLGRPMVFQCQVGQWLPHWHPYEDFKEAYSAKKELGGGVTLTLIHEINLAQKLFGKGKQVAAFFPKTEKLALDVDAIADIMIYHDKNMVSQVHLDYIQSPNTRFGTIIFEHGLIHYDLKNCFVSVQSGHHEGDKVLWEDKAYDADHMYQEELKLFLRYVSEGRMRHDFDLRGAVDDLTLVEAAFKSGKTGQIIGI